MKNLCSTLLLLLAFSAVSTAQTTYLLSNDTVVASVEVPEITAAAASTVTNQMGTPININWTRFILNISPGCIIQVCDPNNCYLPTVSSKTFTIPANGVGNMMVDLVDTTFGEQPASALVRIKYVNTAMGSDTASTYYFLSITASTGTHDPSSAVRVVLYPNPVTESFTLQNADAAHTVRVYNLNGQQVAEYNATSGQRYSLAGQPTGTYFVSIADEKGRILQALEVRKE